MVRLDTILQSRTLCNDSDLEKASMMNALQISPTWKAYYSYPTEGKLGAINALLPAGKICGSFIVAPFSNRFGRKLSLVSAFIMAIIGAAIQAGAVNFGMLLFSRWLLGFGAGFMSQPSPILIAELAYPTNRAKLTSLYHCFFVSAPYAGGPGQVRLTYWTAVYRSNRRRLGYLWHS